MEATQGSGSMKKVSIIAPLERQGQLDFISGLFVIPPYGILSIATTLKKHGYEVRVYAEMVSSQIDWDYIFNSDYIAFSVPYTFCAPKAYQYAKTIREKTRKPIIFGGSHATFLPEDCLHCCDYVVRGEGEGTIIDLLDAMEKQRNLSTIKGISYKLKDGRITHNANRDPIEDFDEIVELPLITNYEPLSVNVDPLESFIKQGKIHLQPIQTSRGCPFACRFCLTPREFGRKYRTKTIETVITEIENGLKFLKNKTFVLVDNDFTVDRKRAKQLLTKIIEKFGPNELQLVGYARVEVGQDVELLELMKRAGVVVLVIGIESTSDEVLKEYDKRQTFQEIDENINRIHARGLHAFAAVIFGAEADTIQTLRTTIDYVIKKDFAYLGINTLNLFPFQTRIFGVPQLIPDNRFIHLDWRFFNGNFVVHYPKNIKPSTLQKEIIRGYLKFYSASRIPWHRYACLYPLFFIAKHLKFYPGKFFGKQMLMSADWFKHFGRMALKTQPLIKAMREYIPALEKFEEGLYDTDEKLIEERLPKIENLCLAKTIF